MADYNFEDYRKGSLKPRQTDTPYVTLQKKGVIRLSQRARALLGNPTEKLFVRLRYDRARQVIAISTTNAADPDGLVVRAQQNNGKTAIITGRGFFNHFHIDATVTRRYAAQLIEGPTLIIDLQQGGTSVAQQGHTNGRTHTS